MGARLLLPFVLAALAGPAASQNVLVVLADDVGVDKVGAYGEHPQPARTPNIDALAQRGILFRNAWAMPACSPTRAAILTGRYPFRTGIGSKVSPNSSRGLAESEFLIPEMLGADWSAAAVGKWHLGNSVQGPLHPLAAGFPLYSGSRFNLGPGGDYFAWEKQVNFVTVPAAGYVTTDTVDDAIRAIRGLPEPWFVYVALNCAHTPLHEPPAHLHTYGPLPTPAEGNEAEYVDAMIEAMDTELGRLFAAVDESDTTLFFLGDNGTDAHAVRAPWDPEKAKGSLFEGGVRVPFLAVGEAVERTGECAGLVCATDLFATVAELAGQPSFAQDSVSLVPYLADPARASVRPALYAERFLPNGFGPYNLHKRAVRDARYKLHVNEFTGFERLFDLQLDPMEETNLLGGELTPEQRERYERLKRYLAELLAS